MDKKNPLENNLLRYISFFLFSSVHSTLLPERIIRVTNGKILMPSVEKIDYVRETLITN